ncbi:hypothetical protein LOD99_1399 [Oopsacas minuta]|uniref:Ketimine reductase mu-crystallin n=1 Tax=Oopsacas minuta TaxID=111878 RepID=A0AAV7K7I6_9METZ|nr:hypothetical protein LOD99_1399 [Oopsacas minuta]
MEWQLNISKLNKFLSAVLNTGQFDILKLGFANLNEDLSELANEEQLYMPSIDLDELNEMSVSSLLRIKTRVHLPTDIVRFYASTEGSVAYRLSSGFIFLQALYEILEDDTLNRESLNELQSDLVRRVTNYSQEILQKSNRTGGQVPEFKSSLEQTAIMCAERNTDYEKLIKPKELISTLEGVLGSLDGKITPDIQPLRHFMEITRETGPSGYFASMPAHIPSLKCFGVKILTLYPSKFICLPITIQMKNLASKSKFVDWVRLSVTGGNGGPGGTMVQWSIDTKYGVPCGGDGGRGGDVRMLASRSVSNLGELKTGYKAPDGRLGKKNRIPGTHGEHILLPVPLGTVVKDGYGNIMGDLLKEDSELVVARGGDGGMGNHNYSVLGKKYRFERGLGDLGENRWIEAEMKTIAAVGLVGFPNAGKSTLLRAISRARPKVASYPFTTLRPYLGAVEYLDQSQIIVADIPGLIQGAHLNKGLGHSFLRHIERCTALVYVLDLDQVTMKCSPGEQLMHLREELRLYQPEFMNKIVAVVANKVDLVDEWEYSLEGENVLAISAENGLYIDEFRILLKSNEATSYPSHSSTVLLYENVTGQLITQLDGDPITNNRTAAISAIAMKHLTSKESNNLVLVVLGSSNQAKSHVRYLTAVKDFKEIRMWSRNADNVNKCISYLQQTHNINTPLIPYSSAEEACTDADVIVTVTLSKDPVVKGSWLKQGAVIICVGACRPDWRELDDELMLNSAIYADSVQSAKAESGDIILSGSTDRIECDLCHIVKEGERDWRGDNKFILFKSLGMAIQDVASAHLIYSNYISK